MFDIILCLLLDKILELNDIKLINQESYEISGKVVFRLSCKLLSELFVSINICETKHERHQEKQLKNLKLK